MNTAACFLLVAAVFSVFFRVEVSVFSVSKQPTVSLIPHNTSAATIVPIDSGSDPLVLVFERLWLTTTVQPLPASLSVSQAWLCLAVLGCVSFLQCDCRVSGLTHVSLSSSIPLSPEVSDAPLQCFPVGGQLRRGRGANPHPLLALMQIHFDCMGEFVTDMLPTSIGFDGLAHAVARRAPKRSTGNPAISICAGSLQKLQ